MNEEIKQEESEIQGKDWNYEDVIALFFQQHEKSLTVPLNNLKLNELRRILKFALFGELSKKDYKSKGSYEKKLGYAIRQAFAERTIMEAVQQEIQIEKHKASLSKLEPIVKASEVLGSAGPEITKVVQDE